ncbi:MAG TPA: DnaJ domain-containing protein [Pseudonocardiaceae bacterium]|jgi:curved DNA-binding protein CbpA|nr:DnaJ domain-containing protein [Pseudonocardiaceae bacterium]
MPPESQDLYAILKVAPDASQTQIGRAYRRLIRAHHPDTHPDHDSAALAAAVAAYAILRDPARRAAYDQARRPASNQHPTAPPPATSALHRRRPEPDIRAGPVRWYPK